jgi:hypothetical protein
VIAEYYERIKCIHLKSCGESVEGVESVESEHKGEAEKLPLHNTETSTHIPTDRF